MTLDSELSGPHCTAADVYQATRGLTAAIEIVDSRIRDWKITIADTVADLASNGAIALSSRVIPLDSVDPRLIGMVFTSVNTTAATGGREATTFPGIARETQRRTWPPTPSTSVRGTRSSH